MRRPFLAVLVLLAAGCASGGDAPAGGTAARVRLLVAGTVDLSGPAAIVARDRPREPLPRGAPARPAAPTWRSWPRPSVGAGACWLPPGSTSWPAPARDPWQPAGPPARRDEAALRREAGSRHRLASSRARVWWSEGACRPPRPRPTSWWPSPGSPAGEADPPLPSAAPAWRSPAWAPSSPPTPPPAAPCSRCSSTRRASSPTDWAASPTATSGSTSPGWDLPAGDAVLLDGEWWALVRPVAPAPVVRPPAGLALRPRRPHRRRAGRRHRRRPADLAASYRHPFRPSALSEAYPGAVGVDRSGAQRPPGHLHPRRRGPVGGGLHPPPGGRPGRLRRGGGAGLHRPRRPGRGGHRRRGVAGPQPAPCPRAARSGDPRLCRRGRRRAPRPGDPGPRRPDPPSLARRGRY